MALRTLADVDDQTITTTDGKVWTGRDSARLAAMIYRRFGKDLDATVVAWRRLLQNVAETEDVAFLVRVGIALENWENYYLPKTWKPTVELEQDIEDITL